MRTCPNCGAENPGHARFCMTCGARLDPVTTEAGERRQVSVLFADLAGFTARFGNADPEDITAALRPYQARLRHEIESFGGTVDKFVGDIVLGIFGAPVAHEDDPERAVRAALRIRETVNRLNEERPDMALAVRVGISTGEALVAPGLGPRVGEHVTGDVVNTASRLQSTAAPDRIVVAEPTYLATASLFRWEALPPITAKGKTEPVAAWSPLAPLSRVGFDAHELRRSPFVGRRVELAALERSFATVVREGRSRSVTVVGGPGMGKSRLIAELARRTDDLPDLVRWRLGRPRAFGEGPAFAPLGDIVRAEAGILDSDGPAVSSAKLDAVVERVGRDDAERLRMRRHLAALVTTRGIDDDATREESIAVWAAFLERLASENPTVLVFEDLHVAADPWLDLVEHLRDRSLAGPLLMVCAARPDLFDRRPTWAAPARITVRLEPLGDDDTAKLIEALADRGTIPDGDRDVVVQRAEGNPLFAEELVQMLRERGAGGRDDGGSASVASVPPTIQALIAARLDTLPAELRVGVQDASVVGAVFWAGAVAAIRGSSQDDVAPVLDAMVARELIAPVRDPSMAGEREFRFRNGLLREVAYGRVPRRERARKHEAVARWLDAMLASPSDERAEALAYHWAIALDLARSAGDQGFASGLTEPAIDHLLDAGARAVHLDPRRAVDHHRRALSLMAPDHPRRPAALVAAGSASLTVGALEVAETDLRTAIELFEARSDPIAAADAEILLARSLFWRGDLDRVSELLRAAVRTLEAGPPSPELARAVVAVAGHLYVVGQYARCGRWAERALTLSRSLRLQRETVMALQYRGASRSKEGDEGGLEDLQAAVALGTELGYGEETAVASNNYAYELWFHRGPRAALPAWETLIELCEARGLGTSLAWARAGILEPLFDLGSWDRALEVADEVLAWDGEHGRETQPGAYGEAARGWVALRRGRVDDAERHAEAYLERASKLGVAEYLGPASILAAEVARARNERDHALEHVEAFFLATGDQPVYRLFALPPAVRVLAWADDAAQVAWLLDESAPEVDPSAWRLRLALSTARAVAVGTWGDPAEALARSEENARGWAAYGYPAEQGQSLMAAARALRRLGRSDEAAVRAAEAEKIFAELGAVPWAEEAGILRREADHHDAPHGGTT